MRQNRVKSKPETAEKGPAGAKLVLKILAGCFFAAMAMIAIVCSVLISRVERLQPYLVHIVVGFALIGIVLVLIGKLKSKPVPVPDSESNPHPPLIDSDHPLAFFKRLEFWGGVLVVAALPIFLLSARQIRLQRKPPPTPAPVKVVEQPVVFPQMHLTGIVWNGAKSTVLINGYTLQVGDMFEGVRVATISSNEATVELNGATKTLKLEDSQPPEGLR